MPELLKAPVTPAQQARDTLLGALVGLARATTNEPKTDDTDEVLNAGLRLAAQPDAPEERLQRMLAIVQTEKHRVAPGCATCAMPCGNTNDYDLARLWAAPETYPHPQAANAFCRVCAGPKAPAGSGAGRRLSAAVHPCRGLGRGASSARSAARAKALPGVNRHPETAFLTRKVCTFRLPRKCCEKSAFFCALAVFVRHCVCKKHSGQFVSRFPAFFRKFFAKKTLQTISKNILYK
ncbi:MAG: hypothetical protein ACLR0Q_01130 [Faecalibacterium sp.]